VASLPAGASRAGRGAAISAHRGGRESAPEGTYAAYRDALAAGADYLEFDVRRTADGELVAFHRARLGPSGGVSALSYAGLCRLAGYQVPTTGGVLALLAERGGGAHIDLKEPDCLAAIVAQALSVLAPERIIVTTGDQAAASELRQRYPPVQAGLTIGGGLARTAHYLARRAGLPVSCPVDAVVAARAGWAVVHARLARAGVLAECRRRGLATMVWTVNDDTQLARWLGCPDVDVVVTDRPRRAAALRRQPPQSSNWSQ
jgi:glycerophosphoryl diester phosphodiesterase